MQRLGLEDRGAWQAVVLQAWDETEGTERHKLFSTQPLQSAQWYMRSSDKKKHFIVLNTTSVQKHFKLLQKCPSTHTYCHL